MLFKSKYHNFHSWNCIWKWFLQMSSFCSDLNMSSRQAYMTESQLLNSLRPMMHIFVSDLPIIDSDNGLLPGWCQAIIWTNTGILLIGPLGTNFSEFLSAINTFSFEKMHLKMSFRKYQPFCLESQHVNTGHPKYYTYIADTILFVVVSTNNENIHTFLLFFSAAK